MKTIYKALLERLSTTVPSLAWIDLDTGQIDRHIDSKELAERPPVKFPAALITIAIDNSRNVSNDGAWQDCNGSVVVRLVFNNAPDRTAANVPEATREKNLKTYDLIAETYAALQGFETENFNALERTGQRKENPRADGLFVYKIVFKTEFEDITAE